MTYMGLILARYTRTCIILEIQTHVPYSFHGFLASFLQLFGRWVDSLIENSKYLVSLIREIVAGSQRCKTTHLGAGREEKLARSLSLYLSLSPSSPPLLKLSLSFPSLSLSFSFSLPSHLERYQSCYVVTVTGKLGEHWFITFTQRNQLWRCVCMYMYVHVCIHPRVHVYVHVQINWEWPWGAYYRNFPPLKLISSTKNFSSAQREQYRNTYIYTVQYIRFFPYWRISDR